MLTWPGLLPGQGTAPDQAHADRLPTVGKADLLFKMGGLTDALWHCCVMMAILLLTHKAVPISTAAAWKSAHVNISRGPLLAQESIAEPPHSWYGCRGVHELVSSASTAFNSVLRKKQIYGEWLRSAVFVQPW